MPNETTPAVDPLLALGEQPRQFKDVFIAAAKTEYRVMDMGAEGRDLLDRLLAKGKTSETRAYVLAMTLHHKVGQADGRPAYPVQSYDADGVPVFASGVIDRLKKLPANVAEALFRVACKLNGLGDKIDGVTDREGN